MDELILQSDLTDSQRILFQDEMRKYRKSIASGVLFCLFLGGIGAHHYYMGNTGLGILYTIFSWSGLPLIISLVEILLMPGRVRNYNETKAFEIATKVKAFKYR